MADKIPHNALVVVADGTGARFFRNSGHENQVSLSAEGEFNPTNLLEDGPAGKRPTESSNQETDEATFAKQLAQELYRRAHSGDFAALVLIADPQTLAKSARHCIRRFRIDWSPRSVKLLRRHPSRIFRKRWTKRRPKPHSSTTARCVWATAELMGAPNKGT